MVHIFILYKNYRETGRQTLVRSKEQPRPVQRVPPMQTQPQLSQHGEYFFTLI